MSSDLDAKAKIDADAEAIATEILADRQWPVTIKLQTPVEFGRDRDPITSLEFRRGKIGDIPKGTKMLDGIPPIDQLLLIASRMCAQPVKVLEMLDDADGSEVLAIATGFFARCLPGGKTRPHS